MTEQPATGPSEGAFQNAGQAFGCRPLLRPQLTTLAISTAMGKVVAVVTICFLSKLSHIDQQDFSRRSRRSAPLNASHGAGRQKPDNPQRPNTGGSRRSQQAPYLFRSSGPRCCSPLTTGATSSSKPPTEWSSVLH